MTSFENSTRFRPEDLGLPLPASQHAVSVCLPTWHDNIGYEEAEPRVIDRLEAGYPRFVIHPIVQRLFDRCQNELSGQCCFVFPSQRVAQRACDYMAARDVLQTQQFPVGDSELIAVSVPAGDRKTLMQFWQHGGEIVTSRRALAELEGTRTSDPNLNAKAAIRARLADLTGADCEDIFLFPTGMAAVFAAYRAFQRLRPNQPTVQFGFPYVDILKIQERFQSTPTFYAAGTAANLDALEALSGQQEFAGLFCEFPGNPLLTAPDLCRLRQLATKHDYPLLVDDTLAAVCNVDVLSTADVLATSLTKYFSGTGDVMGGSLILNRQTDNYGRLRSALETEFEDLLYGDDAQALEFNSRDVRNRVGRINTTCERLCDWLQEQRAVQRIDYPKYNAENYQPFLRDRGGFGGVFSLHLRDPETSAPLFFDALRISKGPNLGMNFSLACPYTILAHYYELDFARRCGISPYLIRVSVGLEDFEWLRERFSAALDQLDIGS